MKGTGKVVKRQGTFEVPNDKEALNIASMLQNGDLSNADNPLAAIPLSQSRVTLQMPTGSFPPNDVLTLIANNFQFKVGDFITVVATPNGDGTFTAQQITKASMSAFQNQVIEYQGTATAAVTCQSTCAGQSISYVIGSTNFSFTMSSDTTVTGFGSPASIAAKQAVDVMVQFKLGASPHVNQVSNPNPASPSTAITPSPSTTIVAFTVQPQMQQYQCPNSVTAPPPLSFVLDNTVSNIAVSWQITFLGQAPNTNTTWATASLSSDTIPAGKTENVTITPDSSLCQASSSNTYNAYLTYTADGLSPTTITILTYTVMAVTPIVNVKVQQEFTYQCPAFGTIPPPLSFVIDNSGSNVPISWQISLKGLTPSGTAIWATAKPQSDNIAAGGKEAVTITPDSSLCQAFSSNTYYAYLTYTAGGQSPATITIFTYTVMAARIT